MNVSEFRAVLTNNPDAALHLMLPDGDFVPAHFHVTEVGRVQKDFIDCGGTTRSAVSCLLQVWVAKDTRPPAHRGQTRRHFPDRGPAPEIRRTAGRSGIRKRSGVAVPGRGSGSHAVGRPVPPRHEAHRLPRARQVRCRSERVRLLLSVDPHPTPAEPVAMLSLLGPRGRLCDSPSRRDLLTAGSLPLFGLALPDVLRFESRKRSAEGRCAREARERVRQGEVGAAALPARVAEPHRHLGPETRRARRHSRRVQGDSNVRPRYAPHRSAAQARPASAPVHAHPLARASSRKGSPITARPSTC